MPVRQLKSTIEMFTGKMSPLLFIASRIQVDYIILNVFLSIIVLFVETPRKFITAKLFIF